MTDNPTQLPYLHGKPQSHGDLRTEPSDFQVIERLPFEPEGEGEHYYLYIRKTEANTLFVARQLAKFFNVKERDVSYAGLKDRHAVTEQWFSVHVPGKQSYDFDALDIEGVELLTAKRHNKKLKTGALSGNTFKLLVRNVTELNALKARWQLVCEQGVPNYFGEQRFGHNGGNLEKATALFTGTKVKDKKKRGIYLSAARSHLFNQMLSKRIEQGLFNRALPGDVMMLSGTQSIFVCEQVDDDIVSRLQAQDISPTSSMWGAGELKSQGAVADMEQAVADAFEDYKRGLPKFGLEQERRANCLYLQEPKLTLGEDSALLEFFLPAGSYATTILRELLVYRDVSEPIVPTKEAQSADSKPTSTEAAAKG